MVPQNGFTFSNGSPFEVIDGALYKNDGGDLILISDRRVDDSGYLEITEQIDGIQAGAFSNVEITNLILPESFSYIVYNEPLSTYRDFYFYTSETNILLFNEQYSASPIGHMSPSAYNSISNIIAFPFQYFYIVSTSISAKTVDRHIIRIQIR